MIEGADDAAVTHGVLLERIESLRRLVQENRDDIRSMRLSMGNLTTVSNLSADAVPRHQKSIDSLWQFVREREGVSPTLAEHARLADAVDRIVSRLERLETHHNIEQGKQIGSQEAHDILRARTVLVLKGLGIITAGGVGVGTSIKVLEAVVQWVL